MSFRALRNSVLLIPATGAALGAWTAWAVGNLSPEQRTLQASKLLKPIPDETWAEIAGSKASERYSIVSGDTLSDISLRLFGDARYWPKIWAMNNGEITNPHVILPGKSVVFLPGSGSSLPSLAFEDAQNPDAPPSISDVPQNQLPLECRKEQWRCLPPQDWESVQVTLPPQIDPDGFDIRSKIAYHFPPNFELPAIAASEKLASLGEITGARSPALTLAMPDVVFIHSDANLQVGQIYNVTREPTVFSSDSGPEKTYGMSYQVLGKVRIDGIKDNLYNGQLTSGMLPAARGAFLIPRQPPVQMPNPIPAPSAIKGQLLVDRALLSTGTVAQNKYAFVDLGSNDGIKPGMVFRSYFHVDPSNGKTVTLEDRIPATSLMVLQTSPSLSEGIIIRGDLPIDEHEPVISLTDVTDLLPKQHGTAYKPVDEPRPSPDKTDKSDELDQLDSGDGLKKDEERTLKQLESWKQNPSPSLTPLPSSLPSPGVPPSPVASPVPGSDLVPNTAPEPLPTANPETAPNSIGSPPPAEQQPLPSLPGDAAPLPFDMNPPPVN